jgi:hypothetical protein
VISAAPAHGDGSGGGGGGGATLWTPEIPFENLTESESSLEGRVGTSLEEELDNLMDISIEIASNKRMKKEFINPIRYVKNIQWYCLHTVQLGRQRWRIALGVYI